MQSLHMCVFPLVKRSSATTCHLIHSHVCSRNLGMCICIRLKLACSLWKLSLYLAHSWVCVCQWLFTSSIFFLCSSHLVVFRTSSILFLCFSRLVVHFALAILLSFVLQPSCCAFCFSHLVEFCASAVSLCFMLQPFCCVSYFSHLVVHCVHLLHFLTDPLRSQLAHSTR